MFGIGSIELVVLLAIAIIVAVWWKVGPPRLK
jgi:hypothetical protein